MSWDVVINHVRKNYLKGQTGWRKEQAGMATNSNNGGTSVLYGESVGEPNKGKQLMGTGVFAIKTTNYRRTSVVVWNNTHKRNSIIALGERCESG